MKTYTEAEFRTLLNDWNNSKFSFSRMVEMVNDRLSLSPQEKQPERQQITEGKEEAIEENCIHEYSDFCIKCGGGV
jgi:hypothetical protein